ncbi:H-NS histone family protein [Xinfangfangia sp. D13-10-4-6]|uniref:H-NS histone family protein n=1 Tax=Pseudogemmobacter hezensis TaxID=2737662 RepID=UPI001553FD0F|nr:H-NS histone family protein [Pseudogemmobacter hezensis]NPD15065.1 H-NS histone family protein [Pseudogemmobacter hezensis]
MPEINLNDLTLTELKKLEKDVTKAITSFEDRKKAEALAALEERAKEFGFTLGELTGITTSRKRSPSEAKYAHPENPEITWSGRGRKPQWINDGLAAGKSLEDFAI